MALSDQFVVVSASLFDDGATTDVGGVFVFELRTGALVKTLLKPAPRTAGVGGFGAAVAITGNTILVGAPGVNSVYAFDARTGDLLQTFTKPNAVAGESFGGAIAVDGDTLLVGATGAIVNGISTGEAYLFSLSRGALIATVSSPATPLAFAGFGSAVALSGKRALIGAPGKLVRWSWARSGLLVQQRDRSVASDHS